MSRPDRGVPRMRRLRSVSGIRPCRDAERGALLAIVNAAAVAYRGVIPADRWHEPYMPASELDEEIAAGVAFWGYEAEGALVGVMGVQPVRDVDLERHGFQAVGVERTAELLKAYWTIPERQIETSVVLMWTPPARDRER